MNKRDDNVKEFQRKKIRFSQNKLGVETKANSQYPVTDPLTGVLSEPETP